MKEYHSNSLEVSVVMPCLNEADTLAVCIKKAQTALSSAGIAGEIIIADNGSTDGSREIAQTMGCRLVPVAARGYGSALMGGIAAARGKFVIMGDADDSYDFGETPRFVEKLREGYDLVQGCRLPTGGGQVLPDAMPWLHRWIGNPLLSRLAQMWFSVPIHDVYCGMRGFTKTFYERLNQRCTGMEFATEMIIRASISKARIAETPITLHPDGRKSHPPHLKTFRDGWRTLRLYLLYSPRWLFLIPGLTLILLGILASAIGLSETQYGAVTFSSHTALMGGLSVLCGYQSVLFAILTKTYAVETNWLPEDARYLRFYKLINLERGLLISVLAILLGFALIAVSLNQWRLAGFGNLDYAQTMRQLIPGTMIMVLGIQTILFSFFVSILGINRQRA